MDFETVIGLTALIVTAATAVITVTLDKKNERRLQEHYGKLSAGLAENHSKLSAEFARHFSNQRTIVGEYFKMLERILIGKQRRRSVK